MPGFIVTTIGCFAAASGIWLILLMLLSWENHRFAISRLRNSGRVHQKAGRTLLIVPVKGPEPGLAENLKAFFCQDHPDYSLHFVVESRSDPACSIIRKLERQFPAGRCRLIVAGVSAESGQKVHNLIAATARIPPEIGILAFADADIRPPSTWLRTLCEPVAGSMRNTVNTGYRWILPQQLDPGTLLVYCINCAVAGLMGVGRHYPIWGGSWAIRRCDFDALRIRDAWHGTLSDDLVASRVVARQGKGVAFDPRCLCPTRIQLRLVDALEFLRRQFVIGKFYSRSYFFGALGALAVTLTAWWGLVWLAFRGTSASVGFTAICGLVFMYAASIFRNFLRQRILFTRDPVEFRRYRIAAAIDIFTGPIIQNITFAIMLWSAFGRRIIWRGKRYELVKSGQVRLLDGPRDADKNRQIPASRRAA